MGFFDNINPFKKKDDFGFPPINNNPVNNNNFLNGNNLGLGNEQPNFGDGLPHNPLDSHSIPSFEQQPTSDPRMNMPMGESLRQGRGEGQHPSEYPEFMDQRHNPLQKDLELISSKLDYLKASLEAINQRLANIEHMSRNQGQDKRW
ncbi:MAG: hypothetical protein NDI94_03455 [Candidatus Woesearchaeota archaeon]|nr:hypothetical protein [Candidatus Woesearchaeota archaeon]